MQDQDLKINTLEIMMDQNKNDHAAIKEAMSIGFAQISSELREFKEEITTDYVRNESFLPVKVIAYGFVGIVMSGFVGLLLTVVWK